MKTKIFVEKILRQAISDEYSTCILEEIYSDVLQDIQTTAAKNYNEDDVRLALGRVLMQKLNLEK